MPAACGELVQGAIGSQDFLVSCPIDLYNEVTVNLYPCSRSNFCERKRCREYGKNWSKAHRAVERALKMWAAEQWTASLEIRSSIPIGKGMASSTADIAAAVAATALALGREPEPEEIARLAVEIEPTDSTIFPALTVFDHRHGRFHASLGTPPPLQVVVVDWGGRIDTEAYNRTFDLADKTRRQGPFVAEALGLIQSGIEEQRGDLIAAGASLSAFLHQSILYKPHLGALAAMAREHGALGVTVAHSGTVAGFLFERIEERAARRLYDILASIYPQLSYMGTYRLIGGGLQW